MRIFDESNVEKTFVERAPLLRMPDVNGSQNDYHNNSDNQNDVQIDYRNNNDNQNDSQNDCRNSNDSQNDYRQSNDNQIDIQNDYRQNNGRQIDIQNDGQFDRHTVRPIIGKTKIGSCLVTDTVGSGGMATIYKVWNERLEVFRAVKLLSLDALYDRFETEAKLTAKLRHQNIVEIYGVGEWNGLPYMEMEFIDGENMQQTLARYGRFPGAVCAATALLMADALAYAHGLTFSMGGKSYSGIIHRDLKPANIMFTKQGNIKLTDFGIARPTQASLHTAEGNIVGTLHYLSPEQMEGGTVDQRSDIYSFGAALYEMATGAKTFPQESITELMKQRAANKFKKPTDLGFPVDSALASIITKCLEPDPKDRYQNAASLSKALQKTLAQLTDLPPQTILSNFYPITAGSTPYTKEPPKTPAPKPTHTAKKLPPLKPATIAIAAAITLALISIPYIIVKMTASTPTQTTSAPATTPEPIIPPEPPTPTEPAAPEPPIIPETATAAPPPKAPEPKTPSEDDLLKDAATAMARKEWARAIRTLERPHIYKEKANTRTLMLLEACVESNNLDKAQTLLEAAAQTNDAHYFLTAGKYWFYRGNHAKALESLEASLTHPSAHKSRNAIFEDAIYYIAVIRSERFRSAPSEANRTAALDGWRRVQSACKSQPGSPRAQRAEKEIAALN